MLSPHVTSSLSPTFRVHQAATLTPVSPGQPWLPLHMYTAFTPSSPGHRQFLQHLQALLPAARASAHVLPVAVAPWVCIFPVIPVPSFLKSFLVVLLLFFLLLLLLGLFIGYTC